MERIFVVAILFISMFSVVFADLFSVKILFIYPPNLPFA